jgi:hypothetical protein
MDHNISEEVFQKIYDFLVTISWNSPEKRVENPQFCGSGILFVSHRLSNKDASRKIWQLFFHLPKIFKMEETRHLESFI